MLQAGQTVAQFRILEKLGEGGMGAVFLAEDAKLGRRVALKVLPEDFARDTERQERFQREARTAASISNPYVMGIYDIGEAVHPETGAPFTYIVMEYVDGRPLNQVIEEDNLTLPAKLRLAERIASGLAAAHKLQVVHRDIKPENILIDADGNPKILDFGLAKSVAAPLSADSDSETAATVQANLTMEGRVVGTVATMSPEQAQGKDLDHRSDIFSFGVLLYRLLTGQAPFTGETQVAVLAKILETRPQAVSGIDPSLPEAVSAVVERCLEKDPERRFGTTQELVDALRAARREVDSGVSRTAGSGVHAVSGSPRSRRGLWLGIGFLVAAAGVFGLLQLRDGQPGPASVEAGEPHLAILRFENKTKDPDLDWLSTGLPEILLTDLGPVTDLSLISLDRVEDALRRQGKDPAVSGNRDMSAAGRSLGATTILYGAFFRMGDQIRIDARLEDASTGEILFADKVVGDDAFKLVDNLTQVIGSKLTVNTEFADGAPGAQMTTASVEAYKYYHLGDDKFFQGQHDAARQLYNRALAVDSTFALPYMRIGMGHVFEGRADQGVAYLRLADRYASKLPPRDRSLLDIYKDIWINKQFDNVYTKMENFVNAYPDDKEALTIHAALVVGFAADTTQGFAEFERVLEMDPTNAFALQLYADDLTKFKQYNRAIALHQRHKKLYPEAPRAYEALGDLYVETGDLARALETYEEYRERFPDDPDVLNNMASLAIRQRDFERARSYLEEIPVLRPGNAQWARIAEAGLINLEVWDGRFKQALRRCERMVQLSFEMADTSAILGGYLTLGGNLRAFGRDDEAWDVYAKAFEYAPIMSQMQFVMLSVDARPDRADELKDRLRTSVDAFRKNVPSNLWHITDMVETGFKAQAARDTTALIAVAREVLEYPPNQRTGNEERSLGELLARVGEYEEALPLVETGLDTTNGWLYVSTVYWVGVCKQGLGDLEGAVGAFEEVLSYWGNGDIEVEPLREARRRLAGLRG